jgi:hypothetical protein
MHRNQMLLLFTLACLLIIVGYQLNSWLTPTVARAQEPVTITAASRFQVLTTKSTQHGDLLVDTVKGRVFEFYMVGPSGREILQELPIKACADADCTTRKRVPDAGQ